MCSGHRGTGARRSATATALVWALSLCLGASVPSGILAQQPAQDSTLQRSQQRLLEIRRERERLQQETERLRGRVHSLASELTNIEQQVQTTGRIVSELDLQVAAMGSQIERTTADLIVAEDALSEKRAILEHRLSEISKRGSLYAARVLLGAESFGDLISRYKYLYLISRQDRQLVAEVKALRDRVSDQRDGLLNLRNSLTNRREERAQENERFRQLERQRQQSLRDSEREQRRMEARLAQLVRDESRLNGLIVELERRRLAAERAAGATARAGTIRTSDLGQLDWPVNGDIIYRFGRQQLPNNTTIRWNGIGIATPTGTPVKAIAAGTVRVAQPLGTYGLSVVIDHGGGYYSVYGFLAEASVRQGQQIQRGHVIGTSGGANSDQGPHVHFEIRGQGGAALDPIAWLRRRQ